MGQVRAWHFDAVIGIGGIGWEAKQNFISKKLTWIGIGPHKSGDSHRPLVTFDHFLYFGEQGPLLERWAPKLARHIYSKNVRVMMDSLSAIERKEVEEILKYARKASPSGKFSTMVPRNFLMTSGRCKPTFCRKHFVMENMEKHKCP